MLSYFSRSTYIQLGLSVRRFSQLPDNTLLEFSSGCLPEYVPASSAPAAHACQALLKLRDLVHADSIPSRSVSIQYLRRLCFREACLRLVPAGHWSTLLLTYAVLPHLHFVAYILHFISFVPDI